MRRRLLRWLGIGIAAMVVLVLIAAVALHTPAARRAVERKVTQLLAAQDITFSSEGFRYRLFGLGAELRNVRLVSPHLPDAPPFLEIARAEFNLRTWPLLRGRYVLETGNVEGVRLHYFVNEQGVDNVPRKPADPDNPSQPIDYLIADLEVPDASVRYEDRRRNIDVILPKTSVTMNGNALTDRHTVTIEADRGTVRWQQRSIAIDRIDTVLDLGRDEVKIARAEFEAEGAQLNASGTFGPFEQPIADLVFQATADAARAANVASLTDPISGQVSVEGTVRGAVDALEITAHLVGHDVQFRELTDLAIDTTATYQMGADYLRVARLNVRGPYGAIDGEAELAMQGDGQSHVNASVEALNADALMRALRLPYRMASRVDGRINARWQGMQYQAASGSGQFFLTPNRGAVAASALPVGGRVDVSGTGGRVTASLRNVRVAGTGISGEITLRDRNTLDGVLHARSTNAQATVDALQTFMGRRRSWPLTIDGALSADARIRGSVRAPVLQIQQAELLWRDARVTAAGTIALARSGAIDLAVRADALQVDQLLRMVNRADIPATGTVAATADVRGTLAEPNATVHVQGSNLIAYQELWGNLTADARVVGRSVDLTSLTIDKPQPGGNGRIAAIGSYQIDTRGYTVDVKSQNLELLTLVLPGGRSVTGGLEVNARSSGTFADPSGQLNLRASDLIVGTITVGNIAAGTTLANRVATTTLTADRYALSAKAEIGVARPYPAILRADIANLDLASLPVALRTPLTGHVRATLDAQGPLAEPLAGHAEAIVETLEGTWREMPFKIDGPAQLRYEDERLIIDRLRLHAQDSTIDVSGNLPALDRSGSGAVTVNADANLATLIQYAPVGTDLAADGRLAVRGTLEGTLKAINPDLEVVVKDALILSPRIEPGLSNLTATATIANGEAVINDLTANWGSAAIGVSARLPLDLLPELPVAIPRQGGPATVQARLDGLNPGTLPGAPEGLGGRISFDADIAARRPDIRDAEGQIAFRDLQLAFDGLTLEQQSPSAIAVRDGVATIQAFSLGGSVGTLAAAGTVGLTGSRPIDVDVDGNLNIAAIALVTDRVRAEGESTIDIAAAGTLSDPVLTGIVSVRDGVVLVDDPRIAAEAVNARLDLAGNRVTISTLSADVNGGTLTGKGGFAFAGGELRDVDVELSTRDFAYDAPLDLRSLSDGDIRIRSQQNDLLVSGQITIQEAGLTGDINFDTGLLATITARRQLELTPERNPLLERLLFNVNVDTATPILVDNNLAKAEVTTDLRVVGTPYETGLLGRLDVLEGGMVTLNERTYEVERGQMTFIEDRRIFPSFDLVMNTSAGNYDIRLAVSGEPGNTETALTASPPLPEPDIMAMLVTGRTLEQMRGEEYEVAREQILSYLTGRVGSTIGRGIERATGFDEVRIEPQLIANEADPGARLTVAEDISDVVTLTYSVDLADSDDQIWMASYDVTRRFQTRAVRQNDNTYRLDFRHDIRRGGSPEPRRIPRIRPEISVIAVPEDAPIPATEIRELLGFKAGDDFDYFAVRDGVEDIEARLRQLGWAESRVRLQRSVEDDGVHLALRVTPGPQVAFVYAGATPPRDVQDEVRLQWHRGVFDAQRIDDVTETLIEWLMLDDYLQGKVSSRVDDSTRGHRRVYITIAPGPRSTQVVLAFEGASGIPADALDKVIDEQKLERQLFTDPTVVTELLERLYREQGYLNADVQKPRYEFDGPLARVIVPIVEGRRFVVNEISFSGTRAIAPSALSLNMPVVPGHPFLPAAAENALQHIRDVYWNRGFNDVRVNYQLTIDRIGGRAGVRFIVNEGRQAVVADIRVAGNDKTSDRLVREQLEITPAQPLNLRALSRSRKSLYDSGAFSSVDLSRDTVVESADGGAAIGAITGDQPAKPVIVDVAVREVQPYQLRYGASFDTEGKLGGIFDASLHNVFGKARVLGFAGRYDARLREGRIYMSQPTLRHWPIQTTAAVYYTEERNPETQISSAFNVDRRGASIQQEKKLGNNFVWNYGYRFERARTFDPLPGGRPDEFTKVSPLSSAFVRETRDEILDATRGSFSSHAFSFSPKWLGSDDTYMKYFGQYFHYFPLQPERRRRFSNEIIRPRLVFATGVRVGWSKGMGAFVPTSERFYAGGSTTIRGFEQNSLGPIGLDGKPIGGDGLLIFNNELRFPLISLLDGVTFLDIGNVFDRSRDFSLTDLRRVAGLGVRVRTKWMLVRGDYGFVLDPRAGEPRSRFFFSIGQAF